MKYLKSGVLVVLICAVFCQKTAAKTQGLINSEDNIINPNSNKLFILEKSNSTHIDGNLGEVTSNSMYSVSKPSDIINNRNSTDVVLSNISLPSDNALFMQKPDKEVQIDLKSSEKLKNDSFNDIKPFLLFPILPFLFPQITPLKSKDETIKPKSQNVEPLKDTSDPKPFIFFDFAFNIRHIPISNKTKRYNDSKIINVKKLNYNENPPDLFKKTPQTRKKRNMGSRKREIFDDLSLFSDMDNFFPKMDPGLFFHRKPAKKLNRKKRDYRKSGVKSEIKFFMDAIDEAFMKTNREAERSDPILNFLRGGDGSLEDIIKEPGDVFSDISLMRDTEKHSGIKNKVRRKANEPRSPLTDVQDSPVIFIDNIVKFGEYRMDDDIHDRSKLTKKKEDKDFKRDLITKEQTALQKRHEVNKGRIENPKSYHERNKLEELIDNLNKKRNVNNEKTSLNREPTEIRILPLVVESGNATADSKNKELEVETKQNLSSVKNSLEKVIKHVESHLKDSTKSRIRNLSNSDTPRSKRKATTFYGNSNSRKPLYNDFMVNITEVLGKFLAIANKLGDEKVFEKLEPGDHDDLISFDWTEKETLQNAADDSSPNKREVNEAVTEEECILAEQNVRQVADLNFLFLTVTLPTVFVFALLLLVCFFNLQIKGKLCTRIFKPRQIFLVEDEILPPPHTKPSPLTHPPPPPQQPTQPTKKCVKKKKPAAVNNGNSGAATNGANSAANNPVNNPVNNGSGPTNNAV